MQNSWTQSFNVPEHACSISNRVRATAQAWAEFKSWAEYLCRPALNGGFVLQPFERGNLIKITYRIMFDFYPGVCTVYLYTCIACDPCAYFQIWTYDEILKFVCTITNCQILNSEKKILFVGGHFANFNSFQIFQLYGVLSWHTDHACSISNRVRATAQAWAEFKSWAEYLCRPALNGGFVLQPFERGNLIKITYRIMFDFYPGVCTVYLYTCIACDPCAYFQIWTYDEILKFVCTITNCQILNFVRWRPFCQLHFLPNFPAIGCFVMAHRPLRGIKDWVQGFWGYIRAKFESILWQMKKLKVIV